MKYSNRVKSIDVKVKTRLKIILSKCIQWVHAKIIPYI